MINKKSILLVLISLSQSILGGQHAKPDAARVDEKEHAENLSISQYYERFQERVRPFLFEDDQSGRTATEQFQNAYDIDPRNLVSFEQKIALICKGADINCKWNNGKTSALHDVTHRKQLEHAAILLTHPTIKPFDRGIITSLTKKLCPTLRECSAFETAATFYPDERIVKLFIRGADELGYTIDDIKCSSVKYSTNPRVKDLVQNADKKKLSEEEREFYREHLYHASLMWHNLGVEKRNYLDTICDFLQQ